MRKKERNKLQHEIPKSKQLFNLFQKIKILNNRAITIDAAESETVMPSQRQKKESKGLDIFLKFNIKFCLVPRLNKVFVAATHSTLK